MFYGAAFPGVPATFLLLQLSIFISITETSTVLASDAIPSRYDYKQTAKKPFLYADNHTIPFYNVHGAALATHDFVRLTSSIHQIKGSIWAQKPNPHKEWMVHLSVHVHGKGRIGGDGLAFWYVKDRDAPASSANGNDPMGMSLGRAYGSADRWTGFGLVLDTYDEHKGNRDNPMVFGLLNDNSYALSEWDDPTAKQIGSCFQNYRNSPTHTDLKVTYVSGTLLVEVDATASGVYELCFQVSNIELPTGYFFGVSSSTSELADNHDLLALEVYELNPTAAKPNSKTNSGHHVEVTEQEKEKLEELEKKFERADKAREEMEFSHSQNRDGSSSGSALSSQDFQKLRESQFLILEHLEGIVKKMDGGPVGSGGAGNSYTTSDTKLDQVRTEVSRLTASMDSVTKVLQELARFVMHEGGASANNDRDRARLDQQLGEMQKRIAMVHESTTSFATVRDNSYSMFTYIGIFLVCQIVVMYAYGVWKRMTTRQEKKFI